MPIETALQLLRNGPEALSNTLKYADARRLSIELVFEVEQAQLRVQETGAASTRPRRLPLAVLGCCVCGRAAAIGADLTMCSALGPGTTLVVALPRTTGDSYER